MQYTSNIIIEYADNMKIAKKHVGGGPETEGLVGALCFKSFGTAQSVTNLLA